MRITDLLNEQMPAMLGMAAANLAAGQMMGAAGTAKPGSVRQAAGQAMQQAIDPATRAKNQKQIADQKKSLQDQIKALQAQLAELNRIKI